MNIDQPIKRIVLICITVFFAGILAACDETISLNTPESTQLEDTHNLQPTIQKAAATVIPTEKPDSGKDWHEITGAPIDEERFVENLDVDLLALIASEIQSLVLEIQEKERADPDYVIQGKWNQDFRASEQYSSVLELGLMAGKPAYFIIYKSDQSGLYEYILASAIDDISGYDYSVTEDYGWSNSKEFLEIYNTKVMKSYASFRQILDDPQLGEFEKVEQIRPLGIFAIAPLLDEIDKTTSDLSAETLEACLWFIIEDFRGEGVAQDLDKWRSENEQTFRNIIEILE